MNVFRRLLNQIYSCTVKRLLYRETVTNEMAVFLTLHFPPASF